MARPSEKAKGTLRDVAMIVGGLAGAACGIVVVGALLLLCMSMPLLAGLSLLAESEDELLFTTTSPGGEYVLEAVRENTAAIEPFYVKVNRVDGNEKQMIYYVRGQKDAEIVWLSDTVAQINGVPVDVTSDECFKANARGYFSVDVQVTAEDVRWLEVTVCMDGEPRLTRSRTGIEMVEPVVAWGMSVRLNVLQELHWDDDLATKKAGLMVTVESADGQKITLPYISEWTAEEYGIYRFTLTGSAEEGYLLTSGDFECTVSGK